MTAASHVVWITGAGRCGMHLTGMPADGLQGGKAFSVELRIVETWSRLCAEASSDEPLCPELNPPRHNGAVRGALHGLDDIPRMLGVGLSPKDPGSAGGRRV